MRKGWVDDGRPVRVLWLIRGLGPGGAERLLVHHARLGDPARASYQAAYFVGYKDQLVDELRSLGVTVHRPEDAGLGSWRWPWRVRRLLRDERIDVVHTHSPAVAAVVRLLLRTLPSRPISVTTEHNRWESFKPRTRVANAVTARLDDHCLAVSADVASSIPRRWRRQVEVLHHGVPLDDVRSRLGRRAAVREALGLADTHFVAAVIANHRVNKDHENILQAALAAAPAGPPLRILLVGQGPLQEQIAARIEELGVGDTVQMLGFRDDVLDVLAAADVLLLGSRYEGLPVAVMEALVLGIPVVATDVGGLPEAVDDGVGGLLVPPARPDLLAAALDRVRRDPALHRALAAGAAARGDDFDAAKAVRRQEDLYDSLVGRTPATTAPPRHDPPRADRPAIRA